MILIDTSVWVDHLRRSEPDLVSALEVGEVLVHPIILGELACGNLQNRSEVLTLLCRLPVAAVATHDGYSPSSRAAASWAAGLDISMFTYSRQSH